MIRLPEAFLRLPLAHRALHDAAQGQLENTRAAISAALEQGYGIEIDLQPSRNGHAMVFHDYCLDRLTDQQGPIRRFDALALSRTVFKDGQVGIPSLTNILSLVAGQVPLLLELKDQQGQMGPTDGTLEDATARAVRGYAGPLAVMSFNPHMVERLSHLLPGVPRGLVTCGYRSGDWTDLREETRARLRAIPDYDRVCASFISHHILDLDRPRVAELKDLGAVVLCWTVRSPEQEAQARRIAANITFEGYLPPLNA